MTVKLTTDWKTRGWGWRGGGGGGLIRHVYLDANSALRLRAPDHQHLVLSGRIRANSRLSGVVFLWERSVDHPSPTYSYGRSIFPRYPPSHREEMDPQTVIPCFDCKITSRNVSLTNSINEFSKDVFERGI